MNYEVIHINIENEKSLNSYLDNHELISNKIFESVNVMR